MTQSSVRRVTQSIMPDASCRALCLYVARDSDMLNALVHQIVTVLVAKSVVYLGALLIWQIFVLKKAIGATSDGGTGKGRTL